MTIDQIFVIGSGNNRWLPAQKLIPDLKPLETGNLFNCDYSRGSLPL